MELEQWYLGKPDYHGISVHAFCRPPHCLRENLLGARPSHEDVVSSFFHHLGIDIFLEDCNLFIMF